MTNEEAVMNNRVWIAIAIGAGVGIALAVNARGRRSRWERWDPKAMQKKLAANSEDLIERGKEMVDRIRVIYEEGRKVVEDAGELWSHGRKLVGA
jgi:hypothetical protein